MKKTIFLSLVVFFAYTFAGATYAQLRTNSNTVRTQVGNPAIQASSCPIPGATPSCGSRNNPVSGCGHCSASYTSAYGCGYESLAYALDIPGSYGQDIILPSIEGKIIRWTFMAQELKSDGRTAIQRYGGLDESNGDQYLLKFHHSLPGSANGTKFSGEVGAKICNAPCEVGTGPHVHLEFAAVNSNGSYNWLEAPLYFCGGA